MCARLNRLNNRRLLLLSNIFLYDSTHSPRIQFYCELTNNLYTVVRYFHSMIVLNVSFQFRLFFFISVFHSRAIVFIISKFALFNST